MPSFHFQLGPAPHRDGLCRPRLHGDLAAPSTRGTEFDVDRFHAHLCVNALLVSQLLQAGAIGLGPLVLIQSLIQGSLGLSAPGGHRSHRGTLSRKESGCPQQPPSPPRPHPRPGPLMRVLVVIIAPIYWALAREHGDALNGHSLTGGSFRQESHMEFSTGEWGLPWGLGPEPRASPRW